MCSGKCRETDGKGKKYSKPKFLLSSLISKRRENRRNKGASIFLDAILTNSILSVQNEVNIQKKKKVSTSCSRITKTKELNLSKEQDEELERICGMNSFFQELSRIKITNTHESKNIKNNTTEQFDYDSDAEINEMVTNFIENGFVEL